MSDERPGVVYVTPALPASDGNGLAMRAGVFLEGMSRRHAVTVAVIPVFGTPPLDSTFVSGLAKSCVTVEVSDPTNERDWPNALLSTPAGRHRARELYPLPGICRRPSIDGRVQLRELIDGARLVHVMRSYLGPCVDFLFDEERGRPVTLDLDELDSSVHRQLGCELEAERFERLERYYTSRADYVYTASGADARIVKKEYGARRVTAVANAAWPPRRTEAVERDHDLLFVGNLSYQPNVDAARWLCEEIRPLLGAVRVAIVGSQPRREVRELGELPGVTVAPDVPEVASWYARSRVAVAPLRVGGGTRIKILEALAHERPVVATPLGAAGLEVGEGHGVLVAATADEFATSCRRLLVDPRAATRIAAAGSRQVTTVEQAAGEVDRLTRSVVEDQTLAARREHVAH